MSQSLESIKNLQGVTGVAVFNSSGACVEHELSPPYDPTLFGEIYRHLHLGLEPYRTLGGSGGNAP